ncbi:TetR/AcrR family transcriptional regulator [Ornithinimicrobium humiphilum]|uniref:TetR family transcriptional regulator n=1 Tax=Ornithinimicrobium humiphilum TaxID=125288 RepID=A0A543KNQ9_9MICO|nr:TetR/AcrR family transcriptional regulator [Ornithinimicrobium humiphilum]TQM96719.1 TetR family transcriptional regulator [Ornithinimicrobium humiphilum]
MGEDDGALPRPVALAWGLLPEPTRGPARGVSLDQVVRTAVGLADAEGIGAVTMSRLARELGFSTMALYRYVESKEELLLLMLDAATTLPEGPADDGPGWREALGRWVESLREVYRAHPWALEVPRGPVSVLMPSSVGVADRGLQALTGLRLEDQERVAVILTLSAYVSSFAGLERDLAGQATLQLGPDAMAQLGQVITPERWPALAPILLTGGYAGGDRSAVPPEGEADNDVEYEFRWGLERILDGIEQLHGRRARSAGEDAG